MLRRGFEKAYAYAGDGGDGHGQVVRFAGRRHVHLRLPRRPVAGAGFDAYAENFDRYFAYATGGDDDQSYLAIPAGMIRSKADRAGTAC